MAYTNRYFTLRWNYMPADPPFKDATGTVKRFRMALQDAKPDTKMNLTGAQRAMTGELCITRVAFHPRSVIGVLRINATDTGDWGSLADLLTAADAVDLECQMYGDNAYWSAHLFSDVDPGLLDPLGNHFMVPIRLEQIA